MESAESESSAPMVLVVDGDQDAREIFGNFLLTSGYRVVAAGDAARAREISGDLTRASDRCAGLALIVSELREFGPAGAALVDALRSVPAFALVPLVVCSSRVLDDDRAVATEHGAAAFLPKPVDRGTLLQCVSRILGGGATGGGRSAGTPPGPPPPPSVVARSRVSSEVGRE